MNRARATLATLTAASLLALGACGGGSGDGDDDPRPDAGPPDAGLDAPLPMVDPTVDGKLTINEVMTTNALTVSTGEGAGADWIELYNPNEVALALNGYGLTDDLTKPRKFLLPTGVSIPARGRLLLWADNAPERGAAHVGFALDNDGGELALTRPDGTFIDRITYGAQEVDLSAAREPDGSDRWVIEWNATPGAPNPAGAGSPAGSENPAMPPEAVPAAGDVSDEIMAYDAEPEFGLTISPQGVAALATTPFEYVSGAVTYRGRSYGPVGIRLKGANSFAPLATGKPSFKIDVNRFVEGARFMGMNHLTFNNMDDDQSMMHERLSYWLARGAGLPASRCNHARVTVNGTAYGLYANVETVKPRMLKRWFANPDGPLFEATDVDFAPQYVAMFEHENGPDDRSKIVGLVNALTIADPDQAMAAAAAHLDVPQFIKFWAFESVVGQYDSFPYSDPGDDYFLYADPARGLTFIPWGIDETFLSAEIDPSMVRSLLANKCKASPACFQAYVDAVWDMLALSETMGLAAERVRVIARIAPFVAADTRKRYTNEEVEAYQTSLYWFIHERRPRLAAMLPPPTP